MVQVRVIFMASSRVQRWPGEMKRGFTFLRVRRTAPIVSPWSFNSLAEPFSFWGGVNSPMSLLFAQPIVGLSKNRPRCAAMPSLRGWAIPWPSIRKQSGVFLSFSTAWMQTGASRKESRPGM